jgi:hypothetical protein
LGFQFDEQKRKIEINNTDFNKKQYFRSETSQWADHQNIAEIK